MGRRAGRDDLGATIFFQLVSARYERGSIILTSKKKLEARPLVQRRSSGGTKLPSRSNTGVSKTRVSGTGPLVGVPKTLVFDTGEHGAKGAAFPPLVRCSSGRVSNGALTHRNVEEAARAVGISTRTLLRWMKVPEFQDAYREARRIAFSQSIARLQQGATAAATTLLTMLVDGSAPASVRVRAAECVLNQATKAIEIEDIEARVAELERAAEASKRSSR